MAKVRTKKEHKKRVARRNNILNQERKRFEKEHKNLLMRLIEEEKNKGMFENLPNQFDQIPSVETNVLNQPDFGLVNGPKI
jgi:hypothetical protein